MYIHNVEVIMNIEIQRTHYTNSSDQTEVEILPVAFEINLDFHLSRHDSLNETYSRSSTKYYSEFRSLRTTCKFNSPIPLYLLVASSLIRHNPCPYSSAENKSRIFVKGNCCILTMPPPHPEYSYLRPLRNIVQQSGAACTASSDLRLLKHY
jgi:hypothetical protein